MFKRLTIMSRVFLALGCFLVVIATACLATSSTGQAGQFFSVGLGCIMAAWVSRYKHPLCAFKESSSGLLLDPVAAPLGGSDHDHTVPWYEFGGLTLGRHSIAPDRVPLNVNKPVVCRLDNQPIELTGNSGESSVSLYCRLASLFENNYKTRLRGPLLERYKTLLNKYDPELVTCAAEVGPRPGTMRIRGRVVAAIFVVAISGIVGTFPTDNNGFGVVVATVGFIVGAALFVLYLREYSQYRRKYLYDTGIVISPDGIALKTKDLTGEMTWPELIDLDLLPSDQKPKLLMIRLKGINIPLTERFDLPLWYLMKNCQNAMAEYQVTHKSNTLEKPKRTMPEQSTNPYAPPPGNP